MEHKTALILEGGAMRGLYSAGILDVLMKNNINADAVYGVSAGALFGLNYKSRQIGRALRYNLKYANEKNYMGLYSLITTGKVMNKEFCFNKLVYELDKLDFETYKNNPVDFYAVVTNLETGKPEYIKIDDAQKDMEYFRASGSMPFVSKPVEIKGNLYLDGAISDAVPFKKALEITKKLGGENYVFWGGREGYETLLNTDTALELDNFAYFLKMAKDYANEIGFKGQFLIEPKPKEPTKHQYDFDTQTVLSFLRKYNLEKDFKMNIEANHATLAGHTFNHELNMARINGVLGSIDANQGDMLLGWDTDQFPTNIYDATLAMIEVIKNGGLHSGGLNFDAKVRRSSFEDEDLAYAYIAGMDTFAKGLRIASKLINDKVFDNFVKERYKSFENPLGLKIKNKNTSFKELEAYALANKNIKNESGHQEMLEAILNQYIYNE